MRSLVVVIAALVAAAGPGAGAGTVLLVDDDAPPGGDGATWATAFRFLQDALAAAAPGTEIRVARGTYLPDRSESDPGGTGDPSATFQLAGGVSLRGGYAGLGAPDPDARDITLYPSILDGDISDGSPTSDCCTGNPTPGCDDQSCQDTVCGVYVDCCDFLWDEFCAKLAVDLCGTLCGSGDAYHVVTGSGVDETAVLDGFTVRGGRADIGVDVPTGRGGALYVDGGGPAVVDCTFTDNLANDRGGAVFITGAGSPAFTGCSFTGNTAEFGGAVAVEQGAVVIAGCTLWGNSAIRGGGLDAAAGTLEITDCMVTLNGATHGAGVAAREGSVASLAGCHFVDNDASLRGAGVLIDGSSGTLTSCVFTDNDDPWWGGGVAVLDGVVSLTDTEFRNNAALHGGGLHAEESAGTVTRCLFDGNDANDSGGGIHNRFSDTSIVNCLFAGNSAGPSPGQGGAVANFDCAPEIVNCTFAGNLAAQQGGAIRSSTASDPTITNCILWNNSPDIQWWGPAQISYSDVQNYLTPFDGNINADPLFVDPAGGDYRLNAGSPCLDAASNPGVPAGTTVDLAGDPRFVDDPDAADTGLGECPLVDMGAHERQGGLTDCCLWDLDDDGVVGILDFLALLALWGADPGGPPDFDGDGVVGILDFLVLLANWGPCDSPSRHPAPGSP